MNIMKKSGGVLADLYLHSFNREQIETYSAFAVDPKTAEIIEKYEKLIKGYSPADLEKQGKLPEELWEGLKKIGIFGLNIPTAYGGVGLTIPQYLKVLEIMARKDLALAIIPTAHLSIGLKGIILFGTEAQKKRYLPPAARGEMIFAYALTEPNIGSDAQHIETRAARSDDGEYYILNGQKTYITNGGYAGGLTVFAQLDPDKPGDMGAFIVETAWEGVKIGRPMHKMGLTISSTTSISFKDVRVPVENLLGAPGDGFKIAMTVLNYGRLGLGAASVGVMGQALDDMIGRASSRKQFGVPIKEFELIQEKIVQARVRSFVSHAMTHFTAHLLEGEPLANVAIESSHTKLFGTTRAWDTLYDALQTAGGAGYISALPYEKRLRDFRVATIFEGTTEIHSIYPPLHLLNILGKEIKRLGKNKIAQAMFMLGGLLKGPGLSFDFKDSTMKAALSVARKNARAIRKLLYLGMIRHGRGIINKEFYLRRITRLSLDLYGILAVLARIGAARKQGREVAEEIRLLGYFIEEARENYRRNRSCGAEKYEDLHYRIFQDIVHG